MRKGMGHGMYEEKSWRFLVFTLFFRRVRLGWRDDERPGGGTEAERGVARTSISGLMFQGKLLVL